MKTSAIAASAILAVLVLGTGAAVFANSSFMHGLGASSASSQSTTSTTTTSGHTEHDQNQTSEQGDQNENDGSQEGGHLNLTVGTTFTVSNLTGHWVAFPHLTEDSDENDSNQMSPMVLAAPVDQTSSGNSTGTFTFKVANSSSGLFLDIVSGSFTINGTTYTVTGGNASLNEGCETGVGQGTASGNATFTIHVSGIHGNITSSAQVGAIKLDVKVGTSEYLVILGNSQGVEEDSQD